MSGADPNLRRGRGRDGGDVVGLVPPILAPYLGTLGHRALERFGLQLPVSTFVAIEAESGRVPPLPRMLDVPADALERLAEIHAVDGRERRGTVDAPIDVDVVCFIGLAEEPVRAYSPGRAAHLLATRALNLDQIGGGGLEGVGRARREGALLRNPVVQAKDDPQGAHPRAPSRLSTPREARTFQLPSVEKIRRDGGSDLVHLRYRQPAPEVR